MFFFPPIQISLKGGYSFDIIVILLAVPCFCNFIMVIEMHFSSYYTIQDMAPVVPDQDRQPMHSNGVAMQSRKRSRVYYGRHREEIRARRSIQRYQHLQSPLNQTFPCHLQDSIDSPTPQPSMNAPPNPNEKIPLVNNQ